MRRPLVAANWKMNGDKASNEQLLNAFDAGINGDADVVVFPPAVYLQQVTDVLSSSQISVGVQNAHFEGKGAFTGELSLSMVKEFDATYVLVGHSERRELFGESDELVAQKVQAVLAAGLVPMLCIGETLEQRERGITEEVCQAQLEAVLSVVGIESFRTIVVAYEPVWAIGTGRTATPEQAQAVHAFIRGVLGKQDEDVAATTKILYGGSVKAANAKELFGQPDIDGGLVGGASLIADEFVSVCNAV